MGLHAVTRCPWTENSIRFSFNNLNMVLRVCCVSAMRFYSTFDKVLSSSLALIDNCMSVCHTISSRWMPVLFLSAFRLIHVAKTTPFKHMCDTIAISSFLSKCSTTAVHASSFHSFQCAMPLDVIFLFRHIIGASIRERGRGREKDVQSFPNNTINNV